MSLGFKQAKNVKKMNGPRTERIAEKGSNGDPLFEQEWDELVIRFDKASRKYSVKVAVQSLDRETADLTRQG